MDPVDPWYWSPEEVLDHVCQHKTLFAQPGAAQPGSALWQRFKNAVLEQQIGGRELLRRHDTQVLLNLIGIFPYAIRAAFTGEIERLRNESLRYQQLVQVEKIGLPRPGLAAATNTISSAPALLPSGSAHMPNIRPQSPSRIPRFVPDASARQRIPPVQVGGPPTAPKPSFQTPISADGFLDDDYLHLLARRWIHDDDRHPQNDLALEYVNRVENEAEASAQCSEDSDRDESDRDELTPRKKALLVGMVERRILPDNAQRDEEGALLDDDVIKVVNDYIDMYTEAWSPGQAIDDQQDERSWNADALWHDFNSQSEDTKLEIIAATKTNIESYGNRLNVQIAEFENAGWLNESEIREQCHSLHLRIDQLEQEKWELWVYQEHVPPTQRPPTTTIQSNHPAAQKCFSSGVTSQQAPRSLQPVLQIASPSARPHPFQTETQTESDGIWFADDEAPVHSVATGQSGPSSGAMQRSHPIEIIELSSSAESDSESMEGKESPTELLKKPSPGQVAASQATTEVQRGPLRRSPPTVSHIGSPRALGSSPVPIPSVARPHDGMDMSIMGTVDPIASAGPTTPIRVQAPRTRLASHESQCSRVNLPSRPATVELGEGSEMAMTNSIGPEVPAQPSQSQVLPPALLQSRKAKRPRVQPRPPLPPSPQAPRPTITNHVPADSVSFLTVSRWSWTELLEKADRRRIVMKVVAEMSSSDREMVRQRIDTVKKQNLIPEIQACAIMMQRGESRIPGIFPRDLVKIEAFTRLFLCWWWAGDYYSVRPSASASSSVGSRHYTNWADTDAIGERKKVPREKLDVLVQELRQGCNDPMEFCHWLKWIMQHTFSPEALEDSNLWAPSQQEIILISSDEEGAAGLPKRKRAKKRHGTRESILTD